MIQLSYNKGKIEGKKKMNKNITKMLSVILTSTTLLTVGSNIPAKCKSPANTTTTIGQKIRNFLSNHPVLVVGTIFASAAMTGYVVAKNLPQKSKDKSKANLPQKESLEPNSSQESESKPTITPAKNPLLSENISSSNCLAKIFTKGMDKDSLKRAFKNLKALYPKDSFSCCLYRKDGTCDRTINILDISSEDEMTIEKNGEVLYKQNFDAFIESCFYGDYSSVVYPLIDIVGSVTGGPLKAVYYYNANFYREILCQDSSKFQLLENTCLGA